MRESYPATDAPSSPAPSDLPGGPPERFQFGLKSLLSLMLLTALLATGVHYASLYILRLNQRVPAYAQYIFLPEAILFVVLLVVWSYFLIHAVFLARHVVKIGRRWRAAQRRRRELESWLVVRRQASSQRASRESPARLD